MQPTTSTLANATSAVGNYIISVSGPQSSNYTIIYNPGSLSITPALLTITANNQSKVLGTSNPVLTVTYSGFLNGDDSNSLAVQPSVTTTANLNSVAGNYPINVSGAVSSNYSINYVAGMLTVTVATLYITVDNQTKVYGSPNPVFTVTYSGFINGDDESTLTSRPTLSSSATIIRESAPIQY